MEKLTLSVDEAAELSGIGRDHLYRLVHRADFPMVHIGGRIHIHRQRFIEWLDVQARAGAGAGT